MPPGIYHHKKKTLSQLFWERVDKSDSCWNWKGSINAGGYGVFTFGGRSGKKLYGHRVSYEIHKGNIPSNLEIDHLCRNRKCVNPDHLEAVTRSINTLRGIGPKLLSQINGSKTHCKHGHEFNESNTIYRKNGGRKCRECSKNRKRKRVP
jgi:hypothetical protein